MHKSVNSVWMVDISLNWEYSQLEDYSNIKINNIDDQPLFHTWLLVHHEDTQDQPKVQGNSHNNTSYTKAASENTIILFACPPNFASSFSWDLQWSQEKTKTMLMKNLGGTNKEYYGIFQNGLWKTQGPFCLTLTHPFHLSPSLSFFPLLHILLSDQGFLVPTSNKLLLKYS